MSFSLLLLSFILLVVAVSWIIYFLALYSLRFHLSSQLAINDFDSFPSLSLLKPICGTEADLEKNLLSFYEQDYPSPIEIIFASFDKEDPGFEIARKIAAQFPHIPSKFVVSDPAFGLNPKVANIAGAIKQASNDLVFLSDANVRIDGDYLYKAVKELVSQEGSILSSILIGKGESTFASYLENLQITAHITPSLCIALKVAGVHCVVGKSMLFYKTEFQSIGGLEMVRNMLCEDYLIGQAYQKAGKKIILFQKPVTNINTHTTLKQFFARHTRWLQMRVVIHVGSFVSDIFANLIFWTTLALFVGKFHPYLWILWLVTLFIKTLSDNLILFSMRKKTLGKYFWIVPLKDLFLAFIWIYSCFSRSVTWRGRKLRFGKNSELYR